MAQTSLSYVSRVAKIVLHARRRLAKSFSEAQQNIHVHPPCLCAMFFRLAAHRHIDSVITVLFIRTYEVAHKRTVQLAVGVYATYIDTHVYGEVTRVTTAD